MILVSQWRSSVCGFALVLLALSLMTLLSCSTDPDSESDTTRTGLPPVEGDTTSILMIGNSNLGRNDLAGTFTQLCEVRQRPVLVEKVIWLGQCLDYQALNIMTQNKIKEKQWDYVVLMGCASRVAYPGVASLTQVDWALDTLKQVIDENYSGSQTVYFMPWAYAEGGRWDTGEVFSRTEMQQIIRSNSLHLAQELDVTIAPVGLAFHEAITNGFEWQTLMHWDKTHPSPEGTYLALNTIYATLFQESTEFIRFSAGLEGDIALQLRLLGSSTVLDSLELWNI